VDYKSLFVKVEPFYEPSLSLRVRPFGWFLQEKRSIVDYNRRVRDCIDVQTQTITVPACDAIVKEVKTHRESWACLGAKEVTAGWLSFLRQAAKMEALASQARIACALELWKLRHGRLPERLEELVPEFLDSVPNQVVDKAPMIYRRVNDQDYLLYSIAWNLKDDGGVIKKESDTGWLDWVWASKPELYREE